MYDHYAVHSHSYRTVSVIHFLLFAPCSLSPGVQGKSVDAIISLKRRQPGNPAQKSTTADTTQPPPRLPRSASLPALAAKATVTRAAAALIACSHPAHSTKVPPPPSTRSAYASSILPPLPSMAIGARSGVVVVPTKREIRGYTSDPRALLTGKNDCGIANGNGWNSFDASGDHSTSDVSRKTPVPIALRDGGSSAAARIGSLDDNNGGGGGGRSSDADLNMGPFSGKRKFGEHFDGGAAKTETLPSKRGCRYLNRYCSKRNGRGANGPQGRAVCGESGGGDGDDAIAAGEGASRQLPGLTKLAKPTLQQRPCAPLAIHAPHGVPGLGREDRTGFAFGYDHGRVGGRATGTPPSSRRSIFCAVLPLDGSTWREKPITHCPAPTITFAQPPAVRIQAYSGLKPEMAMAAAVAAAAVAAAVVGLSPGTGCFLRGACSTLGFSTGPDQFPAIERGGSATPVVSRGTCMDSFTGGVGGGGGGLCSGVGGRSICSFGSEVVFGSFCAIEGDVSSERLDECFMRERVSSPPGQEGLADPGSGSGEFGVGLFHDYSC